MKKRREEKFRSAREFCAKVTVGISYPQYSRYEAGDQLPNLEQALELCKLLDVPVLEGLLEWSRAQIGDDAARRDVESLLEHVKTRGTAAALPAANAPVRGEALAGGQKPGGIGVFTQATISLDDVIVFNRSHLKLFSSDPGYRDIFTYVNSYAPEWIAAEEIALALECPLPKIEEMLEKLSDLGVILLAGGKCRATKRNFYFPDDADFFGLRNLNINHNAASIMKKMKHEDLTRRLAYRGLITRELTSEQVDRLISRMDELASDVVGLPETANPEKIYSLCILLGDRFTRPRPAQIEGLRRGSRPAAPARPAASDLTVEG